MKTQFKKRPFTLTFSLPSSHSFTHAILFYTLSTPSKHLFWILFTNSISLKPMAIFQQSSWQFSASGHILLETLSSFDFMVQPSSFFAIIFGCSFSDFLKSFILLLLAIKYSHLGSWLWQSQLAELENSASPVCYPCNICRLDSELWLALQLQEIGNEMFTVELFFSTLFSS